LPVHRPRRLSCGVVILNPNNEVLLCHVTGQRHWDLPKGGIDEWETPSQAALRETVEETGLVIAPERLIDLGRFGYTARKDLHLFATRMAHVEPREMCCVSTFVERGSNRTLPEMDGFGWFHVERVHGLCTSRMAALLSGELDLVGLAVRLREPSGAERLAA